jgi:hypothetical protein
MVVARGLSAAPDSPRIDRTCAEQNIGGVITSQYRVGAAEACLGTRNSSAHPGEWVRNPIQPRGWGRSSNVYISQAFTPSILIDRERRNKDVDIRSAENTCLGGNEDFGSADSLESRMKQSHSHGVPGPPDRGLIVE